MITGICTAGELIDALTKFNRDTRISAFEITFTTPEPQPTILENEVHP